jgi:hypothetical protein
MPQESSAKDVRREFGKVRFVQKKLKEMLDEES